MASVASVSIRVIEIPVPSRFILFEPSSRSSTLLCSRLTSAAPSPPLSERIAQKYSSAGWQTSPGIANRPSRLCPPHLQHTLPYRYWTLNTLAFSSGYTASYVVSVRRASVLPTASSGSHLAMGTLAVQLTIPPVGFVGDLHPQICAPCRAHQTCRPFGA